MLIRYCAAHPEHFGYPRLLGVRWNGWAIATFGGLCEACRERERGRWRPDPYGAVLIPLPVELGPRTLGRRAFGAVAAAAAAAAVTTVALLVVNPPDTIPSGGDPGSFGSGAQLANPLPARAEGVEDRRGPSRSSAVHRPARRVMASRAVLTIRRDGIVLAFGRGCAPWAARPAACTPPARARARADIIPQSP